MQRIKKEKIKSYILFGLILTSFIQVGILWGYQYHGLPTSFLSGLFNKAGISDSITYVNARDDYFVPFRLILSNGQSSQNSHWLIHREDDIYEKLWEGIKTYIKEALLGKQPAGNETFSADEKWSELVVKKGILVEFKSNIKINLIKWFLNISSSAESEPGGIYKVMIIPGDGRVDKSSDLYIMDGEKVYKYTINNSNPELIGDSLDSMLQSIRNDKRYQARGYWVMKNVDPGNNLPFSYSPDILCVVQGSKYRYYKGISYFIPDIIYASDSEELADIVLASDKYSYGSLIDYDDTTIYKNQDNLYRIYKNGILEYRYISSQVGADKDNVGEAFMNSYRFISSINKHLVSGVDIYLSDMDVKEESGSFVFRFDYIINDKPVIFDYNIYRTDSQTSNSAIVIEANNKRVLYCQWIFKKVVPDGKENKYMVSVENVADKLLQYSDLNVKDIQAAYIVKADEGSGVEPSWLVDKVGGSNYIIPMDKE